MGLFSGKTGLAGNPASDLSGASFSGQGSALPLLEDEPSDLWLEAWEQTKVDTGWKAPAEWRLDSLNIHDEVQQVRDVARDRAKDTQNNERRIPVRVPLPTICRKKGR